MLLKKFAHRSKSRSILDDLIQNLNAVLNSKKHFSSFLPHFGIGDYNAYHGKDKIIETILAEIEENIRCFEPRVELLKIRQVESDLAYRLRFEIQCRILDNDQPIYVIFDSLSKKVAVEMED